MKILLVASVLALSASAASAATYTFHFSNSYLVPGGDAENKTFRSVEDAGITVDVSGHYYSVGGGGTYNAVGPADVDLNSYGLISNNQDDGESGSPNHAIDSWGPDESMVFNFGMDVQFLGTYISWAAGNQKWDVFMDGSLESVETGSGWETLNYGLADNFAIGTRYNGGHSAIKLKKIKIDYTPLEVIPLPAAGWLMLAGLGGLAAVRRRKS